MANIKDWSYAAYIFPIRETDGKKQIAFLVYNGDWYGTIGGRQDGIETPREALVREVSEELGDNAKFIAESAIEIPEKYRRKVAERNIEMRGAKNEEHTFFISKIPNDFELVLSEKDLAKCTIKWVDIDIIKDESLMPFKDTRDNAAKFISFIQDL